MPNMRGGNPSPYIESLFGASHDVAIQGSKSAVGEFFHYSVREFLLK